MEKIKMWKTMIDDLHMIPLLNHYNIIRTAFEFRTFVAVYARLANRAFTIVGIDSIHTFTTIGTGHRGAVIHAGVAKFSLKVWNYKQQPW